MVQRTRNRAADHHEAVGVYEADNHETHQEFVAGVPAAYSSAAVITPKDRVRWGPILAGLFAALSTLVLLSVLGLAVGLTRYEAGDPLRNFGLGAGIWGAVSTILAFLVGGWLAARSAATRGRSNGMMNGAMVWAVAIPLIVYLLGTGVGSLMNMATDVAATGASAVVAAVADQPAAAGQAADAANTVQAQATAVAGQVTPQTVENVAEGASSAAWGTLIALLIGLAAATVGGLLGAREEPAYSPA